MIGNSNNEAIFPHTLLLSNRQVSGLCKDFEINSSANINYQKLNYLK